MKAFAYFTLVYLLVMSNALADDGNKSDINQIELIDFSTKEVTNLSDFDQSKPSYIKLWATWCQPCMEQMPHFQEIQDRYGDKINVFAVNININETMEYIDKVIADNNLSMPVLLDKEGKLSEALGLVGTPYSVLINTDNDIVYTTHESNNVLDTFVAQLASGRKLASEGSKMLSANEKEAIIAPWLEGEHTLFFTATWCDWYLAESRPEMASSCKEVQTDINQINKKVEGETFHGFVNHLWTDNKALADFIELYNINFPVEVDTNGVMFTHFNIRSIPTIIKIKDGKEVKRITGDEINQLVGD